MRWLLVVLVLAVLVYAYFMLFVVPRGVRRYRDSLDLDYTRTTGVCRQVIRARTGQVYEVIEFTDAAGERVVGRPVRPSRTVTDREGQPVPVRYRPDHPRHFITEPLD